MPNPLDARGTTQGKISIAEHATQSGTFISERIVQLEAENARLKNAARKAAEALRAVLTMWHAPKGDHRKLEERLTWRQNDELAEKLANEALALLDAEEPHA